VKSRKSFFQSGIVEWAKHNLRDFPWRRQMKPYSILVAEILLKRTTASAVNRLFPIFIKRYTNVEALANADQMDLQQLLSTLGYHKRRSLIFIEIGKYLQDHYNGKIPNSKTELMEIPFIGQYTAGAIISFGYGKPSSMVDVNIERIIRRFFSSLVPNKGQIWLICKIAGLLVPKRNHRLYNNRLLDHGPLICRHARPQSHVCPVSEKCDFVRAIPKI